MSEEKVDRFRMEYGVPAVLIGWFVTFFVFCLGLTVANFVTGGANGLGLGFLAASMMVGLPVAVLIGLPLALLISWPLRRVRNQRLHVLVFALGVGAVFGVPSMLYFDAELLWTAALLVVWAGASAAIGRASVIQMVALQNEHRAGARKGSFGRRYG